MNTIMVTGNPPDRCKLEAGLQLTVDSTVGGSVSKDGVPKVVVSYGSMSQNGVGPPSQEFKISSSTDRTLARRKPAGSASARKVPDDQNSQSKQNAKICYKRASERPPAAVARRNARERRRVHTVNQAFNRLKTFVPTLKQKTKRVSKLKILKAAIDYVYDLQDILADYESEVVDHLAGKSDTISKLFEPVHLGQHPKKADMGPMVAKLTHSAYPYGGSVADEIAKQHVPINYRGTEEQQISRQNLPYQYPLPIALSHSIGVAGRGMVTVPTIPSSALSGGEAANFYGSAHAEFVPCNYCGHAMPNSGYGANGPCDRCAAFASYNYVGSSSSIAL